MRCDFAMAVEERELTVRRPDVVRVMRGRRMRQAIDGGTRLGDHFFETNPSIPELLRALSRPGPSIVGQWPTGALRVALPIATLAARPCEPPD